MINSKKLSGAILATAAAAIFSTGMLSTANVHAAEDGKVKCVGTNSCKGSSDCATAENSCKGQNVCGGHGFVFAESAEACEADGGTLLAEEAKAS